VSRRCLTRLRSHVADKRTSHANESSAVSSLLVIERTAKRALITGAALDQVQYSVRPDR